MTAEGLDTLRAELAKLEGDGRREIAAQIKTAREWGDLKENAEYHAAKDAQAHLETKIAQLRDRIGNAEVVEAKSGGDVVAFGSTVEIEFAEGGKRRTFTLVSSRDADPSAGKLSTDSPMAEAISGKTAGDEATVKTPRGEQRLRIITIG
jgi:transcription elongation factor GreA